MIFDSKLPTSSTYLALCSCSHPCPAQSCKDWNLSDLASNRNFNTSGRNYWQHPDKTNVRNQYFFLWCCTFIPVFRNRKLIEMNAKNPIIEPLLICTKCSFNKQIRWEEETTFIMAWEEACGWWGGDYQDEFNVAMIASLNLSFSLPLMQDISPSLICMN